MAALPAESDELKTAEPGSPESTGVDAMGAESSGGNASRMSQYRADRVELARARRVRADALSASREAKARYAALQAREAAPGQIRESKRYLEAAVGDYFRAHAELNRLRDRTQEAQRTLEEIQADIDNPDVAELLVAPGPVEARLAARTIDLEPGTHRKQRNARQEPALLEATDVSKKFATSLRQSLTYGVRDLARLGIGRGHRSDELRDEEFWAVRDVSLALQRGDALGVLGSNGSGKSTLVKILAGILPPDTGEVRLRGRLTSVVSVGAGFHPHLTGLENIRVNAAVMGIGPEELAELQPEILAFAGLGERISKPVGMYSAGMRMRLGFAVATAASPDVMIFDEVLAVGDQRFRARCADRMAELRDRSAMVMVSQSPVMLGNYCTHAIWLDDGEVRGFGTIDDVGDAYLEASELGNVH